MKKVTIKDVAKACNVSEATVSRVMSNSPLISLKTKNKVLNMVKEMDYFPNSAAVSLTKSNSNIIAVIVEDESSNPLKNDFFTEILSYIGQIASNNSYYILYLHSKNKEMTSNDIRKLIKSNRVDGLIFLNLLENEYIIDYLNEIDFPYVVIGRPKESDKGLWVDNDNILATYGVTKRLIELGNKNIAFISGPKELIVSEYRKKGYVKALKENGLFIDDNNIVHSSFDIESAEISIKKILEKNSIDAVVTTDDILAIGALMYLSKINKKIMVSGFNNSNLRKNLNMNFMTVDINYEKLAESSVSLLVNKIEKKDNIKNNVIVSSKIIEGD